MTLRRLGVAAVAATILLAGCSATPRTKEEYRMEHEEAKAEVEAIYEQTVAIVGEGWDPSESEWNLCGRSALKDTDSWSRFTQRFGPLDSTPEGLANRVAALWNRLGYPVEVVSDDTITPPRKVVSYPSYLTGTTADGFGVVFTVGADYADFSAGSRCVPADPALDDRFPE